MINQILDKKHLENTYHQLLRKNISSGIDGISKYELKEYLILNWKIIQDKILNGTYNPNIVIDYEILSKKGKKRTIYKFTVIDMYIQKAISLFLQELIEKNLCDNNFSFRKDKGILNVVKKGIDYINQGYEYILEVDIKKYFENIDHKILLNKLNFILNDSVLVSLIMKYQNCLIQTDKKIYKKRKGIITGSSLSPVLSNIYLNELDFEYIQSPYLRYCDNVFIFVETQEQGIELLEKIILSLKDKYKLEINQKKTEINHYLKKKYFRISLYK